MLVVDASVLAPALADDGADGDRARGQLASKPLLAPEVVDLEVASALRRALAAGALDERRAALALADLGDLPLQRVAHRHLIPRAWELRENLTIYDATYVALAELLEAPLITADRRLAGAPGPRCEIRVL